MKVKPHNYHISLKNPIIAVVGPTATGKSAIAQEVALRIGGEILSADSMQVYRGMDIGTGKMLPSERSVPYWGIDLCDPDEAYSAAVFQSYARACFQAIEARGKRAVLCGGTGLYVRAAIDDYCFPPGEQTDNSVRAFYSEIAESQGPQVLWDSLNEVDSASAALIHPNNVRRVVRAFEMLSEGTTYADQRRKLPVLPQVLPAHFFGLAVKPEILNKRIDLRVDRMLESGLVEEVELLLQQGFRESITAPQAIGYKEIVSALDGQLSLDEAIESIKVATHRYAKRQRTWFRRDKRIRWLHADSGDTESIADEVCTLLDTMEPPYSKEH